jgi:ribosomal protein L29
MSDLSKKTVEALKKEISEKKQSLRQFRFDLSGSKTRNVKLGQTLRKEVARLLTELNSRTS